MPQPTSPCGRRGTAANLTDPVDADSDVPLSFKQVALTAQLRLDSDDSPDDETDPAVMYCYNMPARAGIRDLPDHYNNRYQQPRPFV